MPSGGQFSNGSGLRLQTATPGVADVGNADITGTMIAKTFRTPYPALGNIKTIAAGSWSMFGGRTLADWSAGGVAIGEQMTLGSLECIVIGRGASNGDGLVKSAQNSVFIGFNTNWAGGYGGGQGGVCIGQNTAISSNAVAIGGGALGYGARAIAIGQNATANTTDGISIGSASTNGKNNAITIGTRSNTADNQVIIGQATQTDVYVGAYKIGNSTGSTVKVNDSSYAMNSTDGIVMMTAITAARTVTLPLAASVSAGYIVRVLDTSGSASGANSITTAPSGTDTIVGPGTPSITNPYGGNRFMSDGVSKWIAANNF